MLDFHILGMICGSYLLGGIPTGYLVVKQLKGFDIRERGSGNPGTANVYRTAGAAAGILTFAVDSLKGYLPVLLAQRLASPAWLPLACGAAAIVGHDWTLFLGLRGGKGVATSAGVFAALMPRALAVSVAAFAAAVWLSGHISVGSMAGAVALPLAGAALGEARSAVGFSAASVALILYKHAPNLRRLMEGKELPWHGKK